MENTSRGMIIYFFLYIFLFIYSIIFHEIMHGASAYMFGDDTAKRAGRLTLNPIPHIDPLGSIVLPGIGFLFRIFSGVSLIIGWAKPVPVNPYNFSRRRVGEITVSLAGVFANFVIMIVMLFIYTLTSERVFFARVFFDVAATNFFLIYLNILPIPPLDGYNFAVNVLPGRISRYITNMVRGRETVFLMLLFVMFATPIGRFIFIPAGYIFEGIEQYFFNIMGFRG